MDRIEDPAPEGRPSAPGLRWRPRRDGAIPIWIAPAEAVKAGFTPRTVNLAKYRDDTDTLIARCHALQAEMREFSGGLMRKGYGYDRTIGSAVDIYEMHPESPFHRLKPGSRYPYLFYMRKLKLTVGRVLVHETTGLDVQRWMKVWSTNGRHPAAAITCLSILKAALTWCIVVGHRECRQLRDDIRELRVPGIRPREHTATADDIMRARAAAHAAGRPSLALAYAVQFETALRQWDVIGQWVPLDYKIPSAVISGDRKWAGLEWRHIDANMILRFRPSKTDGTSGAEIAIDLRFCPMVLDEIERVPTDQRVGPLVVSERTGLPYKARAFTEAWPWIRTAAGLPVKLWNRDLRASAVTEGRDGGASVDDSARVAGHTKPKTTAQVYDRARMEAHRRFAGARLEARNRSGTTPGTTRNDR